MKTDELTESVASALDGDGSGWGWVAQTKGGAIGAVQFLAVILWAVGGNESDSPRDRQIVDGWAAKLAAATVRRCATIGGHGPTREVVPRDPVTLIELGAIHEDWAWVLAVEDADSFLEGAGMGFRCSDVLAYWRGEPSIYDTPGTISQPPKRPWKVTRPKVFRGYGLPLYELLAAAYQAGNERPTAADVLTAWREKMPREVSKVMVNSVEYWTANGVTAEADLDAIRQAIRRMTDD